jgi:hypothetical protein
MNNYIQQDYIFLTYIIDHYVAIIQTNPSGNYGGTMKVPVEFIANANNVQSFLLNIEGIVAIIYYETYNLKMPSILGNVSVLEGSRINEIYDVMQIPRPTLTIV